MEDYEYSKILYIACGIQASKLVIQMAQFECQLSEWSASVIKTVLHSYVVHEYIHTLFNQL